ncbi:ABC transporter ATP-binding protein [Altericista sp. CCNU0014]|uniref:ABC transporter ATP-binding protein n=1 Tax=Altericista sp. CCNU0014 TaxID=3082949 RepID=UPI00384F0EDB
MASVTFQNVNKIYANGFAAIKNLCLDIKDGEFLVFVGPSGCGKSTALRMLAGLEDISSGTLRIGDRIANDRTPQQRNIAMVFQNYALYPHMTVRQNLEFPLRMLGLSKGEIQNKVIAAAQQLGLEALLDRKPKQLSGGQRQRVAMGRAIVRDPSVFLMDEPLSNLDAKMRTQIRTEIAELQRRLGTTMVYVTHDQVEAMTMGDRVAVMLKGELQQIAAPQDLYDRPANVFVAGFMGSPAMNIFQTQLHQLESGSFAIDFGPQTLTLDPATVDRYQQLGRYRNQTIFAGLRPEAFYLARADTPAEECLEIDIKTVEALGHEAIVYAESPFNTIQTEDSALGATGSSDKPSHLIVRLPSSPEIRNSSKLYLGADKTKLHLFAATGAAIE